MGATEYKFNNLVHFPKMYRKYNFVKMSICFYAFLGDIPGHSGFSFVGFPFTLHKYLYSLIEYMADRAARDKKTWAVKRDESLCENNEVMY